MDCDTYSLVLYVAGYRCPEIQMGSINGVCYRLWPLMKGLKHDHVEGAAEDERGSICGNIMGMYRTIRDRIDADGGADEGYASGYSSGSDKGSGRYEERLKKHLPYLFVDLGPVQWFNKAKHSWEDTHYSLVMNLDDRTPWLLFNRYSFREEDEVDMDEVELKFPYRAAGTLPFSSKRFAFARIEKQNEIEECDEKSDPRDSAFSPDTATDTLAKLTLNENTKQEKLTLPKFSSNKKGKTRDFAKRRFKKDAREAMKAEEQAAIKAKTDAQREDPDSLMENLILNSNQHRKLNITSLDAPLDWILVPAHENPDGSIWREGENKRGDLHRSETVVHPCCIDMASSIQSESDSEEILSLGFLTTGYPDEEQRAAERKQAGASG